MVGRTNPVVHWEVPAELASSPAVINRNMLARNLATRDVPDLLVSYVYLSIPEMRRLVSIAVRRLLPRPLHGVGVELGAGCGLLSSTVALGKEVKTIYAVEVVEEMVALVIPKVANRILGSDASKIVPVVGSFDNLLLPANSVDFSVSNENSTARLQERWADPEVGCGVDLAEVSIDLTERNRGPSILRAQR